MKKTYPRDEWHFSKWIATEAKHVGQWMEMTGEEMWRKLPKELPPLGEFVLFRNKTFDKIPTSLAPFRAYAVGGLREAELDTKGTWRYIDYGGLAIDVKDVGKLLSAVEWTELPL